MSIDTNLQTELADITVADAIGVLCRDLGMGNTGICLVATNKRVVIRSYLGSVYLKDALAVNFGPIEFWGGPPNKRDYHRGSLLTLLCDSILFRWSVDGSYADLVQGVA